MSIRKPPTLVIVLVLLSQVAFAIFGSGLVLCQEADGQVSFEWSAAECCSTPQSTNAAPGSSPQVSEHEQGGCRGCEDSVLGPCQRVESSTPPPLPPLSLVAVLPELPCPRGQPSFRARNWSPGEAQLDFLRTIVIRC